MTYIILLLFLQNVSIAIVGPKTPMRISDEEELIRFLSLVEGEERRGGTGAATGDAGTGEQDDAGDDRGPQAQPQVTI